MLRKGKASIQLPLRLLVVTAALFLTSLSAIAGKVEAYANIGQVTSDLSNSELRAIYMRRTRTWKDGTPVTLVTLKHNAPVHKQFCREILGLFSHQLRSVWDRKIYSGTGQAPRVANSLAEMESIVAETPGAVGYRYISAPSAEQEVTPENEN